MPLRKKTGGASPALTTEGTALIDGGIPDNRRRDALIQIIGVPAVAAKVDAHKKFLSG